MTTHRLGRCEARVEARDPSRDPSRDDGAHVALAGRIDEGATLCDLLPQVPPGAITIDTGGVTFVNSVGMREWIRLLRGLQARGDRITLERVADVLITQMNMIAELASLVRVRSFHAPYVCGACGAEAAPVIDAVLHAARLRQLEAPPVPCPECGQAMELADFPERYLAIFRG